MMTTRTYPPFFAQWLAGGRSRAVSAALRSLTPADMVNIIEGLPPASAPPSGEIAAAADVAFHRLPEVRDFAAYLRASGASPRGHLRALSTAWEILFQKRPAAWTDADVFECLSNLAATRLVSVAQLAQSAYLFWTSRAADPSAEAYRARLRDFVEGALVLTELRRARVIH
jgi:hypothetical protein